MQLSLLMPAQAPCHQRSQALGLDPRSHGPVVQLSATLGVSTPFCVCRAMRPRERSALAFLLPAPCARGPGPLQRRAIPSPMATLVAVLAALACSASAPQRDAPAQQSDVLWLRAPDLAWWLGPPFPSAEGAATSLALTVPLRSSCALLACSAACPRRDALTRQLEVSQPRALDLACWRGPSTAVEEAPATYAPPASSGSFCALLTLPVTCLR